MSLVTVKEKVKKALEKDPDILTAKDKADETFGHNPAYLEDIHGITKSDLIRLQRVGLALKARYEVTHPKTVLWDQIDARVQAHNASNPEKAPVPLVPRKCGTHRTRWIIFKEILEC